MPELTKRRWQPEDAEACESIAAVLRDRPGPHDEVLEDLAFFCSITNLDTDSSPFPATNGHGVDDPLQRTSYLTEA